MRAAEGTIRESAGDQTVLLDPSGREVFTLNRVGSLVWTIISESAGSTRDSVVDRAVEELAATFPTVDRGTLANDVDAFVDELIDSGLVTD